VPVKEGESLTIIKLFFDCVCALMSMQIRQLVMKSLYHFLDLIMMYKVSNFVLNACEVLHLICKTLIQKISCSLLNPRYSFFLSHFLQNII
jgi:hypothetical protein